MATSTTTTGLPEWAQPYVEESLGSAVDLYNVGSYGHVAGMTPEQLAALEKQKTLGGTGGIYDQIAADSYGATQAYRDAAAGTGLFGADALGQQTSAISGSIGSAMSKLLGEQRGGYSQSGNLGGARAQKSMDTAAMQVGGDMAAAELANRRSAALSGAGGVFGAGSGLQNQFGAGANLLGQAGSAIQQQNQNEGDSAYQGIQRLFGLYGSPALGSKSVMTGGGK
ncbi:hypothetical protein OAB94_01965 [Flavobacteriaceae bacterium]|nr:hypothetical protein [Flavobacteriaceae bacterium]